MPRVTGNDLQKQPVEVGGILCLCAAQRCPFGLACRRGNRHTVRYLHFPLGIISELTEEIDSISCRFGEDVQAAFEMAMESTHQ